MKAVRLLVVEVRIPESKMTVSTAGIVPRIYDFAAESVRPKLAISLNAPNGASFAANAAEQKMESRAIDHSCARVSFAAAGVDYFRICAAGWS